MSSAEAHLSLLGSVPKGCERVNFVFRGTEGRSVPCVCSIRSIQSGPPSA